MRPIGHPFCKRDAGCWCLVTNRAVAIVLCCSCALPAVVMVVVASTHEAPELEVCLDEEQARAHGRVLLASGRPWSALPYLATDCATHVDKNAGRNCLLAIL